MERNEFLGLQFDRLTIDEALAAIRAPLGAARFRYVVTPNVDHLVRLHTNTDPEVHAAYETADLSFCDSQVLRLLARLFGISLSTITGSDLVLELIPSLVHSGDRLNLVGGDREILARLESLLPVTRIAAHFPPMGMLDNPAAMAAAVTFLEDHPADYTLLCCGSPQQEIVAYRAKRGGRVEGTALCIGAAVEFLVQRKKRAPVAMRRIGLEWFHRLLSEPRRLWKRYLIRGPRIVLVVSRWAISHRRKNAS